MAERSNLKNFTCEIRNGQNIQAASQRLNWPRLMWKLSRPHTLTASFIPVLVGSALARRSTGQLNIPLLLAMLAACSLIQAATNMFNEFFDYVHGLDTVESVGIAGAITHDGIRPGTIFQIATMALFLAALLGVYICVRCSWWLTVIGAFCMLIGHLYTGGPYPVASTPFGELFAGGFMGSGIVLLSCFVQQRLVTGKEVLVSIPSAILVGAILTANNIRDREGDARNGRHTLAILLGHRKAVWFLASSLVAANVWLSALVADDILPLRALLALGSLWPAALATRNFASGGTPLQMMTGMKRVAQTNTVFGILLVAGLL